MTKSPKKPSLQLGNIKRKPVTVSEEELIESKQLFSHSLLPLLIQPTIEGLDLVTWVGNEKQWLESQLLKQGGLLFRDFNIHPLERFQALIEAISGELLQYTYRSTPRHQVSGNIYTSTEYPADRAIPLHNEMSYTRHWPLKIYFFCVQPAAEGGRTPIADSRRVYERIDPEIRERFVQKKVMYVRNYGEELDLPWQDVFQTTNKTEAEAFCRQLDIEFEWKDNDHLQTRQVCQAIARHPKTGEMVWFNQAHLFHISALPDTVQSILLTEYGEDGLPRNAYYGDGSSFDGDELDHIRAVYEQEQVSFSWEKGDVLLLDNMLVAHGRTSFSGDRKIVVGMAESNL